MNLKQALKVDRMKMLLQTSTDVAINLDQNVDVQASFGLWSQENDVDQKDRQNRKQMAVGNRFVPDHARHVISCHVSQKALVR